jgi:hypothetical protein
MFKFVIPLLVVAVMASEGEFNYFENGKNWEEGVCQTGLNQSPINFTSAVTYKYNLKASLSGIPTENSLSIGLPETRRNRLPSAAIKLELGSAVDGASMLLKRFGVEDSLWSPA